MKVCKEIDCENRHYARGWCVMHYARWKRHGDPLFTKYEMHGYSNHPLYRVWQDMKERCYNKNDTSYENYGERNITICNEWKNGFKAFIEWALPLWKKGLLIDRINNNGNYKPSNCRFVTCKESNFNKKLLQKNNTSEYRGVTYRKEVKRWQAQIMVNGKSKYLGLFNFAKKAALAYNNAVPEGRPKNPL